MQQTKKYTYMMNAAMAQACLKRWILLGLGFG